MPRPNTGPRLKWIEARGCWYVLRYEQGAKRLRSTGTADRREAEKALADYIGASHRDRSGPREPGEITVAEALELYGDLHAPKTADPVRIGYAIDALLPFWGANTLAQITPSACDRYVRERGVKASTAARELRVLRAAVNFLVRDGRLSRTVPVAMPPKPDGKDRFLTLNEAARLLNAARAPQERDGGRWVGGSKARAYLPLFILLGLYTGARSEAILSLRWPQVDLARGRIDFNPPGRTKTKKRRALIPIPRKLMTFLRYAWVRRSSDLGPVLHIDGKPIQRIHHGFANAVKRAGLGGVTPHTLRHTCGTWMALRGVPLHDIGAWLGHGDMRTTMLYAHHSPDFMDAAKLAMDRRKG